MAHDSHHSYPGVEFSDDLESCTVQFTKAAKKSLEKAENELRDKFYILVIWFKKRSLTS